MAAGWAVLRSQPRREPIAVLAASARGLETYVPSVPSLRSSAVPTLLFPGYLFAYITHGSDDLLRLRSAPGVAYILPRDGPPALLPDAVIEAMRTRETELSGETPGATFKRGDGVRVTGGPFKWVEGLFDRQLSAPGRVRILLNLVHGSAAMDIDAVELAPALVVSRGRRGA
jgi:transcriptional antiterminator RfaH